MVFMWEGRKAQVSGGVWGNAPKAFPSNLLKRNPFRAAGDVDDAAAREAVFQNDVLHDRVVVVGVDAQVFCCLLAVGNDLAQQAVICPSLATA